MPPVLLLNLILRLSSNCTTEAVFEHLRVCTGIALRVPTPNVSVVDLVIQTEKKTFAEEVNEAFREYARGQGDVNFLRPHGLVWSLPVSSGLVVYVAFGLMIFRQYCLGGT